MKTFSINTLGCKVNQYESQQIRELLEQLGLHKVIPPEQPDLVVVNTCCVTHTASAKSRQHITRARKQNPNAPVIISGCLPTVQTDELGVPTENVHLIANRTDLGPILSRIAGRNTASSVLQKAQSCPNTTIKAKNGCKIKYKSDVNNQSKLPLLTSFKGHTRAFLKVQDGCDGYCSYCIVPKARPFVRSKPADEALREAQALVESGHREIVLTGIFLGAYGHQTVRRKNWPDQQNDHLADLLDKMAEMPNIGRIRLSSLEPADVTPRLIESLCKHRNIMPHLHLPLQSGSDTILRKMCRQYRVGQFRDKVELLKSCLDRPAITTDIIVGFPGETDADFEQTVDLAKKTGFAKMHVFSFSPRKGTAAADMEGVVDSKVVKQRSEILHDLNIQLGLEYRRQFVGETADILLESENGRICGRSERYFMVHLKNSDEKLKKNHFVKAKLIENHEDGMTGAALC
ncbi:MAG: tRNA (N(6)-L-threonylcarbamoyladenosine(37)-C(2))-methylthiotransferase MtaB [Planctomycetota bacterium]|jgi:threonylcarbamoyladenosine tRNA methylthiotransferase MtaB